MQRLKGIGSSDSDADLIGRSTETPEVFGMLFDRHFDAVHRYLARRVGPERADDLVSQTFIVAFERRGSFHHDAVDARPWLFGIATFLLLNERRSEQRLLRVLAMLGSQQDLVEAAPNGGSFIDADLAAALLSLEADQRDVLLLHALGELSYDEISAVMSIPIGTVRSRMSRARAHLRAQLDRSPSDAAIGQTSRTRRHHG
jgi:RNA polymerase sigma factor (sigma-70 family)